MEVECPIHLALLDAGCAWENDWRPGYPEHEYGVFLGGSLDGFCLRPEIGDKIATLHQQGVTIQCCLRDQFSSLRRLDTGVIVDTIDGNSDCAFVAFVDGLAVGWTFEISVFEDEGRMISQVEPEVIPSYRRRGIGKVLHHLGTEEAVRQGAQYGWTATQIHNPARLIYRSVGFRYWYMCFSGMSKQFR